MDYKDDDKVNAKYTDKQDAKNLNVQDVAKDIHEIVSASPGLIKSIGIFGSLARGDFNHESDIDLLVEYDSPPVFDMAPFTNFCRLCNIIEERLRTTYRRKVDIVHFENDSLDNLFDKNVENEVLWL